MQFVRKNRECVTVKEKHANGVPYLYFPALEETGCVVNGFSTRLGGVSRGDWATMNFSFTRGDDPEEVRENFTGVWQRPWEWT